MRVVLPRLPSDSLARVRLVFGAFSLSSAALLVAVLALTHPRGATSLGLAAAALALLGAKWVADYRHPEHNVAWDLLEATVLFGVGVSVANPLVILLLLYARLSARALEGDTRSVALATTGYTLAFAGTVALARGGDGAVPPVEAGFLASGFPLCAVVMGMLGDILRRLARATERERVLAAEAAGLATELRRQMDRDLRAAEANFSRLFDNNPQPMWVHDEETQAFLAVNDAAVQHYGYSRDEFFAMTTADLRDDSASDGDGDSLAEPAADADQPAIDVARGRRHRASDGRVIEAETTAHRLIFRGRRAVFVMARDVTQERALHAQLRAQAFHDALTGLANRTLLGERAAHALRGARRRGSGHPVMMVLDLDGFKAINDSVGHAFGDEVIRAVGERISSCLRPGDTAARLGGDEFAVLLEGLGSLEEAETVAHRLVERIQAPYRLRGRTLSLSACIGIAGGSDSSGGVTGMLSDADMAMYVAKARGRGAHQVFTPELRTAHRERLRMQEHLGDALANGELRVVYQPQVDLASRRVTGVEALARWRHPVHGEVPPDVFIPMAEELGLVTQIDLFVLRTACADVRLWADAGMLIQRVAVNISGRDLESETLVDDIRRTLVENMLDPWHIELELTEGVAVRQPETAVQRLNGLRALGIRVGIDDFGTGYSMFSRLRDLPIDRLKIDRSFVRDVAHDDDTAAIVASTVAMGHALGLTLVAEGVETEAALCRLADLGCDCAQGFYISPPLPAGELVEWLAAGEWTIPRSDLAAL